MTQAPKQQELAKKPQPSEWLVELLSAKKDAIASVASEHLDTEKLIKLMALAAVRTPKILSCTRLSVLNFVMVASELGLNPGPLGLIYPVPYKDQLTPIIGYRGYIELARRGGLVRVQCEIVRENDQLELVHGSEPRFTHRPLLSGDRGEITHVWCIAELLVGTTQITTTPTIMTRAEVEKIRLRSRAKDDGPWVTDWEEMAKKTVLRRAAKLWPLATEAAEQLARAQELDEDRLDETQPSGTARTLNDVLREKKESARAMAGLMDDAANAAEEAAKKPQEVADAGADSGA